MNESDIIEAKHQLLEKLKVSPLDKMNLKRNIIDILKNSESLPIERIADMLSDQIIDYSRNRLEEIHESVSMEEETVKNASPFKGSFRRVNQ